MSAFVVKVGERSGQVVGYLGQKEFSHSAMGTERYFSAKYPIVAKSSAARHDSEEAAKEVIREIRGANLGVEYAFTVIEEPTDQP